MSKVVIKAEHISKQYRLGLVGTGTVKDDMKRWWYNLRGKEDPFLKIGEANDRSSKGESDYVWSLRDINFEINQGDSVGIIGRNGAGKSTLLKILSQVTQPTTGKIYTKGRIASLLEVGTGFHPEMTGRENIYLNGAILGMRKHEITRKFDEIVAFSGVERYIDTPVKRYSSGMYVRLAFAVAAHLESEILIVDEVLAVGDAEFQKKCLGKMNDVSKGEGRTVLFVSHNMAAVQSLCSRGIVMQNGTIKFNGMTDEAIQFYLKDSSLNSDFENVQDRKGNGIIKIKNVSLFGETEVSLPQIGKPLTIDFLLDNPQELDNTRFRFDIRIDDQLGQRIVWLSDFLLVKDKVDNCKQVSFKIDNLNLNKGIYYVTTYIEVDNSLSDWIQNAFSFEIVEGDFYGTGRQVPVKQSKIIMDFKTEFK